MLQAMLASESCKLNGLLRHQKLQLNFLYVSNDCSRRMFEEIAADIAERNPGTMLFDVRIVINKIKDNGALIAVVERRLSFQKVIVKFHFIPLRRLEQSSQLGACVHWHRFNCQSTRHDNRQKGIAPSQLSLLQMQAFAAVFPTQRPLDAEG